MAFSPSLGRWVAVGYKDLWFLPGQTGAYSDDGGETWTAIDMPSEDDWRGVVWSESLGLFVAVSTLGGGTSPDGIEWTARTLPNGIWWSLAEIDGRLVAVSIGGSNYCAYSDDGESWTAGALPGEDNGWQFVIAAQGRFVVVGRVDVQGLNQVSAYSDDGGETWTLSALKADGINQIALFGAAYSPELGRLVACGFYRVDDSSEDFLFFRSEDRGETWTEYDPGLLAAPDQIHIEGIAWGGSRFACAGQSNDSAGNRLFGYSADGIAWSRVGQEDIPAVPEAETEYWGRMRFAWGRFLVASYKTENV